MLLSLSRWLSKVKGPEARSTRHRRRPTAKLHVELLEARLAPATLSVLEQSFGSSLNGSLPTGGLVSDSNGNLYGTNSWGGAYGAGTVFELVKDGEGYTLNTIVSFNGTNGAYPGGPLISDSNGDLFGTTAGTSSEHGGNNGTVFELVRTGGSYTLNTLASFNGTVGIGPAGGLIADSNGDLFGTTNQGNSGTVFELVNSGGGYALRFLHSFGGSDGNLPNGGLVADSNGNLFGTTQFGGTSNDGTIFELVDNSGSYTFKSLLSFNSANGEVPLAGLLADGNGDLFGTTAEGGNSNNGTVFELVNNSGSYALQTLVLFNKTDGSYPTAGLVEDSSGNIFGTTQNGGAGWGTAFELVNNGGTYTFGSLYSFNVNTSTGSVLSGKLLADRNGDLFGTASYYGPNGEGTVYELVHSGSSYTYNNLASFSGGAGRFPVGGLIEDSNGDLFGTTQQGGATSLNSNEGTVFELVNTGGGYTLDTLFSFNSMDGSAPLAGLIADSSGDLFGTTEAGGAHTDGTVFELAYHNGSYTFSTLASFSGSDGRQPEAGLIEDGSGDLFGTTYYGGANNDGTVFEVVNHGGSYTLSSLLSFNSTNGANPQANLLANGNGDLFGTTYYGGANNDGTVFELVNSGGSYALNTLVTFNFTNGAYPEAGLIADRNGDLFGTTELGGANHFGTVFELVNSGASYTLKTLFSFTGTQGYPLAGLTADAGGDLFGTTDLGGANGQGMVFELINGGSSYTLDTLVSFNGTNGGYPEAGLIADSSGNLFGTTNQGGANGNGTVFEVHRAQMTLASGNSQSGTVGTTLSSPLVVQVTNDQGNPVSGVTVHWAEATGAGSLSSLTSITDSNGDASIIGTLGTGAGSDTFTATVTGLTGSPVTFTATAAADTSSETLSLVSGNGQSGAVATALSAPLVVRIADKYGNPFAGVTVNWAAASGGGSVSGSTSVTDSNGDASINATLGTTAGNDSYTATASGLTGSPVTFTATANADVSSEALSLVSGNGQSGTVASGLAASLRVQIADKYGNPFAGVAVSWAATGGGSVSAPTSTTDSNGRASIDATLGAAAGAYTFTATVSGLAGSPVTFTATANADASSERVSLVSGSSQSGAVATALAAPLLVKISDKYGNPFTGVTVSWAAVSGGIVGAPTSTTDSNGDASVSATLGTVAGSDTFTSTVSGVAGSPVTFTETATPDSASETLSLVSGNNQSGTVAAALAAPLVVQITDKYGNPFVGVTVNWAVVTGGGSVSTPSGVTGSDGKASVNATLGKTAGGDSFSATVSGAAGSPVTFNATARAGTPANVSASAGGVQGSLVNTAFSTALGTTVTDKYGNPVPGVTVVFAAPSSGSSGTFNGSTSVITNASGVATAPAFTANLLAGNYTVTASVTGVSRVATYSLTNRSPLGTSPNAIYVENVYALLLHRAADAGGSYWIGLLGQGVPPSTMIQSLENTSEYLGIVVTGIYQHYLSRTPDPSGLSYWVSQLQAGETIEQVIQGFISSPEFYQVQGHGTNSGFVTVFYQDVLNRSPDASGLSYWVNALNTGAVTPAGMAYDFLHSLEYEGDLVSADYLLYLRRAIDGGGFNYWTQQMQAGLTDQQVLAALLGSAEAFALWS